MVVKERSEGLPGLGSLPDTEDVSMASCIRCGRTKIKKSKQGLFKCKRCGVLKTGTSVKVDRSGYETRTERQVGSSPEIR